MNALLNRPRRQPENFDKEDDPADRKTRHYRNSRFPVLPYVPPPSLPAYVPQTEEPTTEQPAYVIAYGAFAEKKSFPQIVSFLAAAVADPKFRLASKCRQCKLWDDGQVCHLEKKKKIDPLAVVDVSLLDKPERPGAHDPTQGCHGCYYSYLDTAEDVALDDRGHVEWLLQKSEAAIADWAEDDQFRTRGGQYPEHARKILEEQAKARQYREILRRMR